MMIVKYNHLNLLLFAYARACANGWTDVHLYDGACVSACVYGYARGRELVRACMLGCVATRVRWCAGTYVWRFACLSRVCPPSLFTRPKHSRDPPIRWDAAMTGFTLSKVTDRWRRSIHTRVKKIEIAPEFYSQAHRFVSSSYIRTFQIRYPYIIA